MKTKEELEQLKNEYLKLKEKLQELTEEELEIVSGGEYVPKEKGSDKNAKVIYL